MPPQRSSVDLDPTQPIRERRDKVPMDADWLEAHARTYASRWETSEASVRALLERKVRERCDRTGESSDTALSKIPEILDRLVEQKYVSDLRFAQEALLRHRRRGTSTEQIRAKLLAKGISSSLISSLFSDEDAGVESKAAWKLAKRRKLGPYCHDPDQRAQLRERHLGAFSRAGFDYEMALRICDAEMIPESE